MKSNFWGTLIHEIVVAGQAAQSSDQWVWEASGTRRSRSTDPKAVAWKVPVDSSHGEASYVAAWEGGAIQEEDQLGGAERGGQGRPLL